MKRWYLLLFLSGLACGSKDEVNPVFPKEDMSKAVVVSSPLNGNANANSAALNGTVSGAVPTADRNDVTDNALYFNGANSYIDFGNSISTDSISTISIWAKFDTLGVGMPDMELISKSSYRQGMELVLYNGKLSFYLVGETDNNNIGIPFSSLKTDTWYHIAAIYDRQAEQMKLYLNGELQKSDRAPMNITEIDRLMLGSWSYVEEPRFFKGSLDDFSIYNRPLTDAEISALYQESIE